MKQAERFVTLALVLSLVAVPAIASAQGGSSPGGGIGAGPAATPDGGRGYEQPNRVPAGAKTPISSKDGSSMGSRKSQPASANDCKDSGYKTHGFKTEAECLAEVKQ